jgi:cysteine desulfurase
VRPGLRLAPQVLGGGQEGGLRAGTENLAGAVGLGVAAELAFREGGAEASRLENLRDRLLDRLAEVVRGFRLLGARRSRLPHHVAFVVPGVKADSIVLGLDLAGISAATGSACSAMSGEPSSVLRAMGLDDRMAQGGVALSLGRWTTPDEIDAVLAELPLLVERLRAASPLA